MVLPCLTQISPKLVGIYQADFQNDTVPLEVDTNCLNYEMSFHLSKGAVCKTLVVKIRLNGVEGPIQNPHLQYYVHDEHINVTRPWFPIFAAEHNSFADVLRELHHYGFRDFTAQKLYATIRSVSAETVDTQYFRRPFIDTTIAYLYDRTLTGDEFDAVTDCISRHLSPPDLSVAE
jgi:hypothetical protein